MEMLEPLVLLHWKLQLSFIITDPITTIEASQFLFFYIF